MILVNVLLIVALASSVVVLMLTAQDEGLQRAIRAREAAQADAAIRGGELSAIAALRRDAATAPTSDNLAEPWAHIGDTAVPIAHGRFTLAIADAQARFNINALARGDVASLATMTRIGAALGLRADTVPRATALIQAVGPLSDLAALGLAGIDRASVAKLAGLVTALPGTTQVNLNTADARLLGILLDNPVAGETLAARRGRQGYLTADDFALAHALPPPGTGFTSNLYWVLTRVTIGDTAREQTSLLLRRSDGARRAVVGIGRWTGTAPAQAPPLAE